MLLHCMGFLRTEKICRDVVGLALMEMDDQPPEKEFIYLIADLPRKAEGRRSQLVACLPIRFSKYRHYSRFYITYIASA